MQAYENAPSIPSAYTENLHLDPERTRRFFMNGYERLISVGAHVKRIRDRLVLHPPVENDTSRKTSEHVWLHR